jgi:predicted RNA-binding protein with PIN domain
MFDPAGVECFSDLLTAGFTCGYSHSASPRRIKWWWCPDAPASVLLQKLRFPFADFARIVGAMALVRILVDGYSLLHNWPQLAPHKPRHSAAAREELIHVLTQYRDAIGTPITVVFDGAGARPGTPKVESTPEMEVLYSEAGQTADDVIERAAHRLSEFGEVLVVTDDYAERDTVLSLGSMASSCLSFIQTVESTLADLQRDLKRHNRKERQRFQRTR